MSFAGAGWSNLLQSKWPVFGILRRVRERLFQPGAAGVGRTRWPFEVVSPLQMQDLNDVEHGRSMGFGIVMEERKR